MIARIKGKVLEVNEKCVVIDCAGLGYEVRISGETARKVPGPGETVTLFTHFAVREDSQDLYGFTQKIELGLFKLLIGISGIGPKSALSILGLAPVESLVRAIGKGDLAYLTKVSGIGKKSAEKIILELQDKLRTGLSEESGATQSSDEDADIVEAVKMLGYRENEARAAVSKIKDDVRGIGNRVKEALKILGSKNR